MRFIVKMADSNSRRRANCLELGCKPTGGPIRYRATSRKVPAATS